MCIIIYAPAGHIPKKHLKASLENNRDGWGLMWGYKGTVQIMKGMTQEEFYQHWSWVKNMHVPLVFHARIATHGTTNLDNCHPFEIPGHDLAMAHNGILTQHSFQNKDDLSDTRLFIRDIVQKLPKGFQNNEGIRDILADYIGHSKLVFMSGKGHVRIINARHGEWACDNWYSNTSYKSTWTRRSCHNSCGFTNNNKIPYTTNGKSGHWVYSSKEKAWVREEDATVVVNTPPTAATGERNAVIQDRVSRMNVDVNTAAAIRAYYKAHPDLLDEESKEEVGDLYGEMVWDEEKELWTDGENTWTDEEVAQWETVSMDNAVAEALNMDSSIEDGQDTSIGSDASILDIASKIQRVV